MITIYNITIEEDGVTVTDLVDQVTVTSTSDIITVVVGGDSPSPRADIASTDELPEGTTNLYYTEARVDANTNVAANTTKLAGIEANANNYTHPTGDGNLHVPATTTINDGKVLTAGSTAGAVTWETPTGGASTIDDLLDTTITAIATDEILKWNGIAWVNSSNITNIDYVDFDTTAGHSVTEGQVAWNANDSTINIGLDGEVVLQVGQETVMHAKASEAITNGDCVYASGAVGASGKIEISKYIANNTIDEIYVVGVATQDIAIGEFGFITTFGNVRGIPTNGTPEGETWIDGTILYASPTVAGRLTKTLPTAPNQQIVVAMVVTSHASNGTLFARPSHGYHLFELHDVHIDAATNGEVLKWNTNRWENNTLAEAGISATGHTHTAANITDFDTEVSNNTSVVANTAKDTNVTTNLGYTPGATTGSVTSSDGTDATLPAATTLLAGLQTATDKTKLDTIETNAKDDQTAGEIEAIVSHDNLIGYVANEHIDWTTNQGITNIDVNNLTGVSLTGHTHVATDITDFDTEVSNNTSVVANTAKITNATHTGDVTGSTALTIANNSVTNAKLTDVATQTIKGRTTAATGDPEDLTATQVRAIINVEDGATADQTKVDIDALNIAANTAATLETARNIALSGDVTGSASFDGSANINIVATSTTTVPVQDEGVGVLTTPDAINFVGGGVTVTDTAGVATVTITGAAAAGTIITQDEGTNVDTAATTVNFVGAGVTATNAGGNVTLVTIPGGGTGTLDGLTDTTITTNTSGEILKWNGLAWINNTLTEAGVSATGHSHVATDITDFDTEVSNNTSVTANTAKVTNVTTNLGYATAATTGTVTSSDGTDATLPAATIALAGLMTATDKVKLNNIETNATADQTAGELEAIVSHDNLIGYVALQHIDWSADQGATNIHAGNYTDTNTTYVSSDFTHDDLTGFVADEHIDWSLTNIKNIHADNYTDTNTTYSIGDGGLTEINFTSADNIKLDGIEALANNYTHPTGDGNLHVPANGITNDTKVLTASAVAGVYTWETPSGGGATTIDGLTDTTITTNTAGELLKWNGSAWINNTLAEAGIQSQATVLDNTTASFTIAEETKLSGIETLATADQTAGEIEAIVSHDNLLGYVASHHIDWSLTNVLNIHADNYTNTTYSIGDGGLTEINFTTADNSKLDGIELLADVTDTANVTAAGALMDSEVDVDIKTLVLPAATTITTFAQSFLDDIDAATVRTTLGVDVAGTINYTHPSDGVDPGAALTGANVFSDITVNTAGHVTGSATRALTAGDISALALAGGTLTGRVIVNTARATVYTLTGTVIDGGNGDVQTKTLASSVTFTETMSSGDSIELLIDDGTAFTVTWPTITWTSDSGVAPTLQTTGYTRIILEKVASVLYGHAVNGA